MEMKKQRSQVEIHGLSFANPEFRLGQREAAEAASELIMDGRGGNGVKGLYLRSGVDRRHSVILDAHSDEGAVQQTFYPKQSSPSDLGPSTEKRMLRYAEHARRLAKEVVEKSIRNSSVAGESITHMVSVSCTGFYSPGFDLEVIEDLKLSPSIARTHIGFMGCQGALNGLRVARSFAEADPDARVLLCCLELSSIHHQYSEQSQQIVANSLFADGAAAAVVGKFPSRDLISTKRGAWKIVAQNSLVIPQTMEFMTWKIADHGFQMTLSPKVPEVVQSELKPWLNGWLASVGMNLGDIDSFAFHPGGPRILNACQAALELSDEQLRPSRFVLNQFGNMSSPTVLFILDEVGKSADASTCLMLAFGPGLTVEACVLNRA